MTGPVKTWPGLSVQRDGQRKVVRALPEEAPVAMVFDGTTQAVMMASPTDLEDFAVGFALSEGFVTAPEQIEDFEIAEHESGIEARFWLAADRAEVLKKRRRKMAGPVGCGLCGIDSLDEALRELPILPEGDLIFTSREIAGATDDLRAQQPLHDRTHAVHAAGFMRPGEGIMLVREDVGRHNALDKLIGALSRHGIDPTEGAIVLTSRVSLEMVQKTVIAGAPVLVAVSAPTARALREAEAARLTVAAFVRGGGFDLYSHPNRIQIGATDVA